MGAHILSAGLGILGIVGIITLLTLTGVVLWHHRGCSIGTFRWHIRNQHFKQLSALACLFCLAMAASYIVLLEAWALLYLVIALKTGTWWLRLTITQRA